MKLYCKHNSNKGRVYKIVNTANGRIYIGEAKVFRQRFYEHRRKLKSGSHGNKFLQHDFIKCSEEAFEFHIVEIVNEAAERSKAEEKRIAKYYDKQKQCYNFQKKSDALPRRVYSNNPENTKKLLSKKAKAMWKIPELREKILKRKESVMKTPRYKEVLDAGLKKAWANSERRNKTSERLKQEHNKGSRKKAVEILKKSQPKGRKTFKERMKRIQS